jgi:hypothetical protein
VLGKVGLENVRFLDALNALLTEVTGGHKLTGFRGDLCQLCPSFKERDQIGYCLPDLVFGGEDEEGGA